MRTYTRLCCRCSGEFETTDHRVRTCPGCKEAQAAAEARKPLRQCKRCGATTHHRDLHGRCLTCRDALSERQRAHIRQEEERKKEVKRKAIHADFDATFERLPINAQRLILLQLVDLVFRDGTATPAPAANDVIGTEEEAAHNQDAIDAAFRELMDGVL